MAVRLVRRRFTVDEYYRMAEAGILDEDDRVELLEGEIVEMTPIGSRHAAHVDHLTRLWLSRVHDRAIVRVQHPVRLSEQTELQPDLALVRPRTDRYTTSHPGPDDVLLLVEVAQATRERDHREKLPLYARYGIGEVRVVDLQRRGVDVYRTPAPDGDQSVQRTAGGDVLPVEALPDLAFQAQDLLI